MNRAIEFFNTKEGPAHMINSGAKVSFETANDHLHHCEGFCGQVHKLSPATHKSTWRLEYFYDATGNILQQVWDSMQKSSCR